MTIPYPHRMESDGGLAAIAGRKRIIAAMFVASWVAATAAADDGLVTVVDHAIAHSAGIQSAEARLREAESALAASRALRLPQLSADVEATRGDGPVYVFGSLLSQQRFRASNFAIDALNDPSPVTNIRSSLWLGMPLFSAFHVSDAIRLGELKKDDALSGREDALQRLRFDAAAAYIQAAHDAAVLAVLDEHLATADREMKEAFRLKERGVVLGSDFYAAQAIDGGLRSRRAQVASDRTGALDRLRVLSGMDRLAVAAGPPREILFSPPGVDELVSLATNRPDARRAKTGVGTAEVVRHEDGRSLLPRIQAFAAVESDTRDFGSNPTRHLYGLSAHVPFGDLSYVHRRRQAVAGLEAARLSQTALDDQIRIEVTQAYDAYQGVLRGLPQLRDNMEAARRSLELFRPLYRSGRQSILDVLRAEEATALARTAYQEALFHLDLEYLRLMLAAGLLDEAAVRRVAASFGDAP